ncbi:MAG: hypothetical protein ACREMK_00435 [Gemmatimonadota bacterium]
MPALGWRHALLTNLETLPPDSMLAFDPWLGAVVPGRPTPLPDREGLPVVSGLDVLAYLREARSRRDARLWRQVVADRLAGRRDEEEGLIPELENPLRIPEPLARVFGEGSEFDVQGKLHLGALGARSKQNPDLRTELLRRTSGNFDLDLDQTLDLKILGTVGTKLDVAVDFNSQRELESRQLITAAYTGSEDEVLQKVEMGDISVALPPSRFLGGSVGTGTFGAQAVAQLGPMDFRVLGTRKEGESTERSLSIAPSGEGVLSEITLDIKDTQFQRDRFFLLFHPDSLALDRLIFPNPGTVLANPASQPVLGTLNVWLDDGNFSNNREQNSKRGEALVNPVDPNAFPEQTYEGFFDLLIEGQDYVVTDGIVLQMRRQLNDSEVLGVSYLTGGGTQVGTTQDAEDQVLKLVKPTNPDTLDFTWDYTLRNIYSLREPNIQLGSLELEIYRGNQDLRQTFESIGGESRKYSQVFGLTDANGRVNLPRILRDPFQGPDFIVLPDVRPFFQPTDETGAAIPIERPNRQLYFNSDPNRTALDDQVYFIEASYLSRGGLSGEIELGSANVIEGSERISIGTETLVRGEDYQILYELGRLVLSDPAALAERHPNDRLAIQYEVAPLFNLAPTTLYGAAGSYRLGQGAVLNSTLMLQRKESLANRPILGAEPTQALIAEVDGSWSQPMVFMDRWLAGLPGSTVETPSSFSLRGEMAFSRPDPNTDGQVFLNDFENIEIAKRLSLFFRVWHASSMPTQSGLSLTDIADARWYTFFIPTEQVTGERRGEVDVGENNFVVRLDPIGETPAERMASWRSIETVLSTTGEDLTRQEFIEFFVRGVRGEIIVDLGAVDEDAVRLDESRAPLGLGELDTEEANPDTRDNNLDVNEDTGLDGVPGQDAADVPGDDGTDDFDERSAADGFPINPNGGENNSVLETEDSNLNGILDRQEDLLRWEIDLTSDRYVVPGSRSSTGFRRIRLPLVSPDQVVGSPDLRNARIVRMAFSGLENPADFEIVDLEIVGSTFLKRGIVGADGTPLAGQETDSLQVTAINDRENPDYVSPPGVIAEQDRADQVAGVSGIVREQSLELTYRGLPQSARGTIYRPLFDRESYIDYERMRVWVQGRGVEGAGQPSFFVSFGIDTLNVYEYAAPLRDMEWEEHVIDFEVFTELKRALLDSLAEAGADTGTRVSEDGRYRVRVATADTPPPTLTEVSQLTIGVENSTGAPVTGSFWIDEWRLTAPLRDGGAAAYINAQVGLADVARVDVSYEARSGRYRNLGAGRNNFDRGDLDVNALVRLDQFLPESWGVSVPLTWNHFGASDIPLYRVGSDILVTSGADRDSIERSSESDLVTLRAFRTRQSSNPLISATLDRLELRMTYRDDNFGSVDLDSERGRWDTYIGYRSGFRKRALPLGLGWLAGLPWPAFLKDSQLLQRLASVDLNLVPADVTVSATTAFEERAESKLFADGADFTADTTRNLSGQAAVEFQPFASMRARVGWDSTRDLVFPETVFNRPSLGTEALRSQNFDFDWSPPVATWLTPRYSYSSSFTKNHTREASRSLDSLDVRDFGVSTNHALSLQIGLPQLVGLLQSDGGDQTGPVATSSRESWWEQFFEPIRYDARRRENVFYVQEENDPTFGFGWGFGDLDEENQSRPQNFGRYDEWGLSTGIEPLEGLLVRGSYRETDDTRRYLEGVNLSSTRVWPSVDLQWRNIQLPGFLQPWVATTSVTSAFERRTSDNITNDQLLSDSDRRQWDPILSFGFTLRNGLSTDIRAVNSQAFTTQVRGGAIDSRREENSTDYLVSLDYDIRPGTTLYIPFPTLWGVKLKQPLLTSLTFARRYRLDETNTPQSETPVVNLKTVTTEVRPSIAYEFGRVVSGFAINYLSRKDQKRDIRNTTIGMEAFLDFLF